MGDGKARRGLTCGRTREGGASTRGERVLRTGQEEGTNTWERRRGRACTKGRTGGTGAGARGRVRMAIMSDNDGSSSSTARLLSLYYLRYSTVLLLYTTEITTRPFASEPDHKRPIAHTLVRSDRNLSGPVSGVNAPRARPGQEGGLRMTSQVPVMTRMQRVTLRSPVDILLSCPHA